jgi:hypothetical protein
MSDKAAWIIALSIVLATTIHTFFQPYTSCVRTIWLTGTDARTSVEACARWVGGAPSN